MRTVKMEYKNLAVCPVRVTEQQWCNYLKTYEFI